MPNDNLKNVLIIEEALKRRGKNLPLGVSKLFGSKVQTQDIQNVALWLTKISTNINNVFIKDNARRLVQTRRTLKNSNFDEEQAALIEDTKEDIEDRKEHIVQKTVDSLLFLQDEQKELVRELNYCIDMLAKNPEDLTIVEADNLSRYLVNIFSPKNSEALFALAEYDDRTTADVEQSKVIRTGKLGAKATTKDANGNIIEVTAYTLISDMVNGLDNSLKGHPYIAARNIVAENCGYRALIELDGYSLLEKPAAILKETEAAGGIGTVSGFNRFITFLTASADSKGSIGQVADGEVKHLLNLLDVQMKTDEKGKVVLNRPGWNEADWNAVLDTISRSHWMHKRTLCRDNVEGELHTVLEAPHVRGMDADIFISESKHKALINDIKMSMADDKKASLIERVLVHGFSAEKQKATAGDDYKTWKDFDKKTIYSSLIDILRSEGLELTPVIREKVSALADEVIIEALSEQVIKYRNDYLQRYAKCQLINRLTYELSGSLCGSDKTGSGNAIPGNLDNLLTNRCVYENLKPIAGTSLQDLVSFYYHMEEYIAKLNAIPVEHLDSDSEIVRKITEAKENAYKELEVADSNIKEFFRTAKAEDVYKNISSIVSDGISKGLPAMFHEADSLVATPGNNDVAKATRARGARIMSSCNDTLRSGIRHFILNGSAVDTIYKAKEYYERYELDNSFQTALQFFVSSVAASKYVDYPEGIFEMMADTETLLGYKNWSESEVFSFKQLIKAIHSEPKETRITRLADMFSESFDHIASPKEHRSSNTLSELSRSDIYDICKDSPAVQKEIRESLNDAFPVRNTSDAYMRIFSELKSCLIPLQGFDGISGKQEKSADTVFKGYELSGKLANLAEIEAETARILLKVPEEKRDVIQDKVREMVAAQIADTGYAIAYGAKIGSMENVARKLGNTDHELTARLMKGEVLADDIKLGTDCIGKASSMVLVNDDRIIAKLNDNSAYRYAQDIVSLEEGYNGPKPFNSQALVSSYLRAQYENELALNRERLERLDARLEYEHSAQVQFDLCYAFKYSGSTWDWEEARDVLESMKINNPYDDFSKLEKAIISKDRTSASIAFDQAMFCTSQGKNAMWNYPDGSIEYDLGMRFIREGQAYLDERDRQVEKEIALCEKNVEKYEKKLNSIEDDADLLIATVKAFEDYSRVMVDDSVASEISKLADTSVQLSQSGSNLEMVKLLQREVGKQLSVLAQNARDVEKDLEAQFIALENSKFNDDVLVSNFIELKKNINADVQAVEPPRHVVEECTRLLTDTSVSSAVEALKNREIKTKKLKEYLSIDSIERRNSSLHYATALSSFAKRDTFSSKSDKAYKAINDKVKQDYQNLIVEIGYSNVMDRFNKKVKEDIEQSQEAQEKAFKVYQRVSASEKYHGR